MFKVLLHSLLFDNNSDEAERGEDDHPHFKDEETSQRLRDSYQVMNV